MRIFHYDSEGYLMGEGKAEIDPLETRAQKKAVYLLPAMTTSITPPDRALKADHIWQWKNQGWIEVIDPIAKAETERIEKDAQKAIAEAEREALEKANAEAEAQAQEKIDEEMRNDLARKRKEIVDMLSEIKERPAPNLAQLSNDLKAIVDLLLERYQ